MMCPIEYAMQQQQRKFMEQMNKQFHQMQNQMQAAYQPYYYQAYPLPGED